jgi:hypothetical protein
MMRMLGIGLVVVLAAALVSHGSLPVEAAKKEIKANKAPEKTGTGPIVTGRFGIRQYDVSGAGKNKGKKGN